MTFFLLWNTKINSAFGCPFKVSKDWSTVSSVIFAYIKCVFVCFFPVPDKSMYNRELTEEKPLEQQVWFQKYEFIVNLYVM